ncbi:MAG TPA: hypothetical protein VKQ30_12550 [Ktedonobacterales bacterium]|nr:hypothetical protein [Ktedonobacterales bacterium]
MSTSPGDSHNHYIQLGYEAALRELRHLAVHLEARGCNRVAVTLYDAIRIARAGGLRCEEHTRTP